MLHVNAVHLLQPSNDGTVGMHRLGIFSITSDYMVWCRLSGELLFSAESVCQFLASGFVTSEAGLHMELTKFGFPCFIDFPLL